MALTRPGSSYVIPVSIIMTVPGGDPAALEHHFAAKTVLLFFCSPDRHLTGSNYRISVRRRLLRAVDRGDGVPLLGEVAEVVLLAAQRQRRLPRGFASVPGDAGRAAGPLRQCFSDVLKILLERFLEKSKNFI